MGYQRFQLSAKITHFSSKMDGTVHAPKTLLFALLKSVTFGVEKMTKKLGLGFLGCNVLGTGTTY